MALNSFMLAYAALGVLLSLLGYQIIMIFTIQDPLVYLGLDYSTSQDTSPFVHFKACKEKSVGLILHGSGRIGQHFLRVFHDHLYVSGDTSSASSIKSLFQQQACGASIPDIVAISDSTGFIIRNDGLKKNQIKSIENHKHQGHTLSSWNEVDDTNTRHITSFSTVLNHFAMKHQIDRAHSHDRYIIVDCTSSNSSIETLIEASHHGFGIVLANKKPLSGLLQEYEELIYEVGSKSRNNRIQYEASVGAGLPVITTLKRIITSSDNITSIEGAFSGTIGYIISEMKKGSSFSEALNSAYEIGLTESHPKDDLSGVDVARKALILAREMGMNLELSSVQVKSLFPDYMTLYSVRDFMHHIADLDTEFQNMLKKAIDQQKHPVFLARITPTSLTVGLELVDQDSPFSSLKGTDTMIVYTTEWNPRSIVMTEIGTTDSLDGTVSAIISDIAIVACSLFCQCL